MAQTVGDRSGSKTYFAGTRHVGEGEGGLSQRTRKGTESRETCGYEKIEVENLHNTFQDLEGMS